MQPADDLKERILDLVSSATNQKIRPRSLEQAVVKASGLSVRAVRQALNDLMREELLVYTYRDPCSFVELPQQAEV